MEKPLRLDHPVIVKKTYTDHRRSPSSGSGSLNFALTDNRTELKSICDATKLFPWRASLKVTVFDSEKPPTKDVDQHIIMEAEIVIETNAHLPNNPQEHLEKIITSAGQLSAQYLAAAIKSIFTGTAFNSIQLPNLGTEIAMETNNK